MNRVMEGAGTVETLESLLESWRNVPTVELMMSTIRQVRDYTGLSLEGKYLLPPSFIDEIKPVHLAALELWEKLHKESPAMRIDANDLAAREIFDRGERMVLVRTDPYAGLYPRPQLSAIENWAEYLKVRSWDNISVWNEDDARLQHSWKSSWHPRPTPAVSHEARVRKQAEELRVQADAKRIVQAERSPAVELNLISVADLLTLPEPEWWVDSILPKDSVIVVGGDGGVGKSAMLVEMVSRLSTGTPFLGRFAARKGRTLYAVGEGMRGYGARFTAVSRAHGLDADQIRIVDGVSMTSEKSMEQVRAVVAQSEIGIVIFDTLSSLSTLESENDAAEVGRLLNSAKRVREANPGCTVIIVHHTNKASGGLRGSSVIRDNADMVWMLRGDPDAFFMSTKSKHGGKVKDGEPMEIHGLSLVSAHGSVVVESASFPEEAVAATDRRVGKHRDQLVVGQTYTTGELRKLVTASDPEVSEATAKRTISTAVSEGYLTSTSKGQYVASSGQQK